LPHFPVEFSTGIPLLPLPLLLLLAAAVVVVVRMYVVEIRSRINYDGKIITIHKSINRGRTVTIVVN
jgi:hypothetical protein